MTYTPSSQLPVWLRSILWCSIWKAILPALKVILVPRVCGDFFSHSWCCIHPWDVILGRSSYHNLLSVFQPLAYPLHLLCHLCGIPGASSVWVVSKYFIRVLLTCTFLSLGLNYLGGGGCGVCVGQALLTQYLAWLGLLWCPSHVDVLWSEVACGDMPPQFLKVGSPYPVLPLHIMLEALVELRLDAA